jgi:branched-chain amino acid transport system permease protein
VFVCVSLLLWRIVHSPFGRVVKAIKQNETRARFIGYDVWRYKAAVLVLSAALSGLAGGLFSMAQLSAFPDVMSLHYSGYVVMITLVGGGLVSFWGPVVGAIAFFLARDVIGAITTGWMLWFGLFFVTLVLFKPEGIAGMFSGLSARRPKPAAASLSKAQAQAR